MMNEYDQGYLVIQRCLADNACYIIIIRNISLKGYLTQIHIMDCAAAVAHAESAPVSHVHYYCYYYHYFSSRSGNIPEQPCSVTTYLDLPEVH